jgi:hypothetical protein
MLKTPDARGKFFSVSKGVSIQGTKFNPAICYPLTDVLRPVIEKLEAAGMARTYTEKMRFVSGVAYPVRKPETGSAAKQTSSASRSEVKPGATVKPVVKKSTSPTDKTGRKSGRSAFTSQTSREFD